MNAQRKLTSGDVERLRDEYHRHPDDFTISRFAAEHNVSARHVRLILAGKHWTERTMRSVKKNEWRTAERRAACIVRLECPDCGKRLYVGPSGSLVCEDWQCGGLRGGSVDKKLKEANRIVPGDTRGIDKMLTEARQA